MFYFFKNYKHYTRQLNVKKLEEINVTDEDWVPLDYLETSLN